MGGGQVEPRPLLIQLLKKWGFKTDEWHLKRFKKVHKAPNIIIYTRMQYSRGNRHFVIIIIVRLHGTIVWGSLFMCIGIIIIQEDSRKWLGWSTETNLHYNTFSMHRIFVINCRDDAQVETGEIHLTDGWATVHRAGYLNRSTLMWHVWTSTRLLIHSVVHSIAKAGK